MKKILFTTLTGAMLAAAGTSWASPGHDEGDVVRLADHTRYSARPDEIIVKFKDTSAVQMQAPQRVKFRASRVSAVDHLFAEIGVTEIEELMPMTGARAIPHKMKGYTGREVQAPAMDKVYRIALDPAAGLSVHEAISRLEALDDVEYAEPNYLVYSLADDEPLTDPTAPNDPYYSLQWGLEDINMKALWGQPVISKDGPVIAILDTGVDITHPDLKANIWVNPGEVEGVPNYDDDCNGYDDDLHGYDFVNRTGTIIDYNGHGTHCAGIAAASGFNSIGIIGANPYARIMPLTVLQSNGQGDVATIVKAIDYAAANGANVISMSLGSYSDSRTLEEALGRAYSKAVIVAAAGNDGYCLNHPHPERGQFEPMPMFPGAYTFVVGVQASNSNKALASFSNYDDNGPTYSDYSEDKLYNYEVVAPGASIMSTFPNGQYKYLNGTSMATPLVAGAISRLLQAKEYTNREELMGDLISSHGKTGVLDMLAVYQISDKDRLPELQLVNIEVVDEEGDNDGRPDAGETVCLYPTIRNLRGNATNIRYKIEIAEQANTICEFLDDEADFGLNLSSYAKGKSLTPIRIKFNDNVVDGRVCCFRLIATCDNQKEELIQEFQLTAENGVELGGVLAEDMTLKSGVHYIVTKPLAVPEGVTLTIEPGTVVKFRDNYIGINVAGNLICDGEPGNMITFTKVEYENPKGVDLLFNDNTLSYVKFENLYLDSNGQKAKEFRNCVFDFINPSFHNFRCIKSNFMYCTNGVAEQYKTKKLFACNIIDNNYQSIGPRYFVPLDKIGGSNVFSNFYNGNKVSGAYCSDTPLLFFPENPNYLGSIDLKTVANSIVDVNAGWYYGQYDLNNMLLRPTPEAHGIVWKVEVDGYDAQDEFDLLPPLGVGRHKFEVYFNRVMNHEVAPVISMGVREPYTQTIIGEEGAWRTEMLPFSPFGNSRGLVDVKNGTCNYSSDWGYGGWTGEGCLIGTYSHDNWPGAEGSYLGSHTHETGVPQKLYQRLEGSAQNGRYKLQISAKVDRLADTPGVQYVYLNDTKVDLDENALKGAVYEVIADVRDNTIEVGIAQTENIGGNMYIDNVSLTLLEEYSNERMEPVSVYTAYLTLKGKENIDGLNRIYVYGAEDDEFFEIPYEKRRFNVMVQAAGSLSSGFFGEAGLGKVMLTWEEQDDNIDDILGYNLYRYTTEESVDSEGNTIYTDSEPVCINNYLLDQTNYTDFDVVPGKTYSYYYKIMRTSLTENSPSKVVAVTPLTAQKGDANGSMSVDVADVVTEVGYMLEQNPKPFIFEAADVNSDHEINILDVVGTLNIIMHPAAAAPAALPEGTARYWLDDEGVLYVDSDVALAGLQFTLNGVKDSQAVKVLPDLDGMEVAGDLVEGGYMFMAYSLVGRSLTPGTHALLKIESEGVEFSGVAMSDPQGHNVKAEQTGGVTGVNGVQTAAPATPWPNPFAESVTIPYRMPFAGVHRVSLLINDLNGCCVDRLTACDVTCGEHSFRWSADVQPGVYLASLYIDGKPVGVTFRLIKK